MWRGVIGLALSAALLAGCSAQAGEAARAQPSPAPSPRVAEAGADLYPTLEIAQAAGYAVHAEESDVSDSRRAMKPLRSRGRISLHGRAMPTARTFPSSWKARRSTSSAATTGTAPPRTMCARAPGWTGRSTRARTA